MERSEAIATLPPPYQRLLRLLEAGAEPAAIAAELDVDPAGLPALVALAHAKLDARLTGSDPMSSALLMPPPPPDPHHRPAVAGATGRSTTRGGER
jgi:hypothetical protein